jgi:RimJ/RimL family protein N-acetyltransferase
MIQELPRDQFEGARPLCQPLALFPFCAAVLAGIHPGRVFVDQLDDPRSTFVVRDDAWCFLAGDPGNDAFNQAVNRLVREALAGKFGALFTCHPEDWGGQLSAVFAPQMPIPCRRRHYVCRTLQFDWHTAVPDQFAVVRLEPALLESPGLQVPELLQETLTAWRTNDHPCFQDYGFAVLYQGEAPEVVSWATVDAIVDGLGDAGLFTLEAYRRRGLATVCTAAAVEHGLSHGLSAINWTCMADNAGSFRIAEKLGFEQLQDHLLYDLIFDEVSHLANLAWVSVKAGRYEQAAAALAEYLARCQDPPDYIHLLAARTWAVLGDRQTAWQHLRSALDKGFADRAWLEASAEFADLRGTPEWAAVLACITLGPASQ